MLFAMLKCANVRKCAARDRSHEVRSEGLIRTRLRKPTVHAAVLD